MALRIGRVAAVLVLFLTALAFDVSSAAVSESQESAVPVCAQGMLTPDLSTCYVVAVGQPLDLVEQIQLLPASGLVGLTTQCPTGFEETTFVGGEAACARTVLVEQPRSLACPAGTSPFQGGELCAYPGGPILIPCTDAPDPGHTPPCTPPVSVWACDGGFVSADGSLCLSDEVGFVQRAPSASTDEYPGGASCVAGFDGPNLAGMCSRVVLRAEPDVLICSAGQPVALVARFGCSSDATPVLIECALQPTGFENGACSRNDALWEPLAEPVSTCSVGQPTPDQSRCFTFEVDSVTLPGATTPLPTCPAGTLLDIGARFVCLFDEVPIVSGCDGLTATVDLRLGQVPTEGADVIIGTEGDDVIAALGGDDVICGLGGNDRVWGGSGNDWIFGQDGDDVLRGGPGDDVLSGGIGADNLAGSSGNDRVWGGDGDDPVVRGGTGDDFVDGGRGSDALINGNGGRDQVTGGYGNDKVVGGPRPDEVSGGSGNDEVKGNKGADMLWGGLGSDMLFGGPQPDQLLGGTGTDSCSGGTTGGTPPAPEGDSQIDCESIVSVP